MARHREDDTTGAGTTPAGAPVIRDDDPTSDLPDPLGLGGTPPPDAPSRRPKPRFLALLGEFFRMSRTTAILLGVFVLAGALYLLVRDEPVVAFGPPAPPATSAPAVPDEPTSAPTESATETRDPTPTSATGPSETDPLTTGTSVPEGTATSSPGTDGRFGGTVRQTPQQQPAPQQTQQTRLPQQEPEQQSQPQGRQEAPAAGEAAVPDGGAVEG